jgi:hypothetical protein
LPDMRSGMKEGTIMNNEHHKEDTCLI